MIVVDVPHVFRVFHGPRGLMTVLAQHQPDVNLNYNQVQMWQQRKQVPTKFVAALFYCIIKEGHEVIEFLIDASEFV